jgi:hypothetical protein
MQVGNMKGREDILICALGNNIKNVISKKGEEIINWISRLHGKDQWRACVDTQTKLRVLQKANSGPITPTPLVSLHGVVLNYVQGLNLYCLPYHEYVTSTDEHVLHESAVPTKITNFLDVTLSVFVFFDSLRTPDPVYFASLSVPFFYTED